MNFKENIEYRASLNKKAYMGGKFTHEEKEWCASNPTFNPLYDEEIYQRDIIQLSQNKQYLITVSLEHTGYNADEMIPILSGIAPNDRIVSDEDYEVRDFKNNIKRTPVRMLGLLGLSMHHEQTFVYNCESGKFCVEYECEYYDPRMNLYLRAKSTVNYGYAFKKRIISDSKVRYNCKHPMAERHDFGGLVFTVEWKMITSH